VLDWTLLVDDNDQPLDPKTTVISTIFDQGMKLNNQIHSDVDFNYYDRNGSSIIAWIPTTCPYEDCQPFTFLLGIASLGTNELFTNYDYQISNTAQIKVGSVFLNGANPSGDAFDYSINTKAIVREIGHNRGLLHSNGLYCNNGDLNYISKCQTFEYLDRFDSMGGADSPPWQFNAIQKQVAGWLSQVPNFGTGPNYNQVCIQPVSGSKAGVYNIKPLELQYKDDPDNRVRALKITDTVEDLYWFVEYRQPIPGSFDDLHGVARNTYDENNNCLGQTLPDRWANSCKNHHQIYNEYQVESGVLFANHPQGPVVYDAQSYAKHIWNLLNKSSAQMATIFAYDPE
jgi:hypothetical protein